MSQFWEDGCQRTGKDGEDRLMDSLYLARV
jgi:hypothetical protein